MASSSETRGHSREKTNLLIPCLISSDVSESVRPRIQNRSASSPHSEALIKSVTFCGWRYASSDFISWTAKMSLLHEATWRKAGIFDAIMASTKKILKDPALVLSVAERWCPQTNSFLFPWGEATITLQDVMVLLGFSASGLPYFTRLDTSGKETKAKLDEHCEQIKKDKGFQANQVTWVARFMDSGHELEHVAFLASWLSYFVFPYRYYHIFEYHMSIAVHLSRGTRIALAPPVLAHLYKELSHLRHHIRGFNQSTIPLTIHLSSLFKLVQVWTWERFRELQPPKPNPMLEGEPRLALWHDLKQRASNATQILQNSTMDSFELLPYTKPVEDWNVTSPQVITRICFPESAETLRASCVHSGSKMNITGNDGMKRAEIAAYERHKYMKRVREDDESSKGLCQTEVPSYNDDEEDDNLTIGLTLSVERRFKKKYSEVENSGGDVSEPLGKRSTLGNHSCPPQKLASTRADGDESELSPEIEQRNEESDETGSKPGTVDENNSYDDNSSGPPVGFDGAIDIVVSPPETMPTCDDDLNVHGSNAEKETMMDETQGQDCLLHKNGLGSEETLKSSEHLEKRKNDVYEDEGALAGGEKSSSDEKGDDDDDLVRKKLAAEELASTEDNTQNFKKLKLLATSLEERIVMAETKVARLKERKAMKQKKISSSRLL